jgi:glucose-1-phosphate thymidylyltransferase
MKALIPCAGEGIRMRPLTLTKPKQLLEVGGKPILEHIIESLPREVDEVILVIGYLGTQIKKYFGDYFDGRKIHYIVQKEKLGTAHAVALARHIIGDETFLMMYGDDIIDGESIKKLMKYELAILVKEVEDPRRFGVVITDRERKIKEVVEKPVVPISNLAITGVKILDMRILDYIAPPRGGEYILTEALGQFAKEHDIYVEIADTWLSIATPEDLERINETSKTFAEKI